ncbi:DUF736 domain-containing protein [Agrobacterium tumefaciens]|uniref:DUF736 domain-containing protein n=1 Tax=Agrobacterium tumefaciens TaxID=358 RepID=UPI0021D1E57D|nr:DUF736 domain-containing protein [Agrobacterium tumefaciens]UXS05565.1 DUF736 domain-containing protein [Agrobacterium tumefaciens]
MAAHDLTNYVIFDKDGKGLRGNIASISYDIDIFGEQFASENPKAPAFRLFAKSPLGKKVEIGGVWLKLNREGGEYHQMTLSTGHGKFHANLGRFPGQEDDSLMAVIPWD